jgi:hypothetical protein
MSRYAGLKSLDAEIDLDLVLGEIRMDYSLSKIPAIDSSSLILDSEWRALPIVTKLKYAAFMIFLLAASLPVGILMLFMTIASENGKITDSNIQYKYQNFLRWYALSINGLSEQLQEGQLRDTVLEFNIQRNVWFEYKLTGDYQEKVKKISLRRRFISFKRYGIFSETRQVGWKVIFEFTEPPQSGKCLIRYV